ncbi:MAG: hypothetical protein R3C05_15475 [Pirellulaceae bacterium]
MARSYAVSLGALALCLIALRGAIIGDDVASVVQHGLLWMIGAIGAGYLIGAIADQLVCETVEIRFRQRVSEVIDQIAQIEAEKQDSRTS